MKLNSCTVLEAVALRQDKRTVDVRKAYGLLKVAGRVQGFRSDLNANAANEAKSAIFLNLFVKFAHFA